MSRCRMFIAVVSPSSVVTESPGLSFCLGLICTACVPRRKLCACVGVVNPLARPVSPAMVSHAALSQGCGLIHRHATLLTISVVVSAGSRTKK